MGDNAFKKPRPQLEMKMKYYRDVKKENGYKLIRVQPAIKRGPETGVLPAVGTFDVDEWKGPYQRCIGGAENTKTQKNAQEILTKHEEKHKTRGTHTEHQEKQRKT